MSDPLLSPPDGPVGRVLDLLARACILIAGIMLVALIASFGWLVYGRYILNNTPTWVEQSALLLVVWITFLGAAAGVWTRSHLSIDFVREMLPMPIRVPLRWLALAGMLVFSVYLAWQGFVLVQQTWPRVIPMLGISEGLRALPMSICGVLSTLFTLWQIGAQLRGEVQ